MASVCRLSTHPPTHMRCTRRWQLERWLPRACSGEHIGGMGMSEPSCGTDVLAMRTTAQTPVGVGEAATPTCRERRGSGLACCVERAGRLLAAQAAPPRSPPSHHPGARAARRQLQAERHQDVDHQRRRQRHRHGRRVPRVRTRVKEEAAGCRGAATQCGGLATLAAPAPRDRGTGLHASRSGGQACIPPPHTLHPSSPRTPPRLHHPRRAQVRADRRSREEAIPSHLSLYDRARHAWLLPRAAAQRQVSARLVRGGREGLSRA